MNASIIKNINSERVILEGMENRLRLIAAITEGNIDCTKKTRSSATKKTPDEIALHHIERARDAIQTARLSLQSANP